MTETHHRPAGWYRDPGRPNRHRYWNGTHWIGPVGENLGVWARVLDEGSTPVPSPRGSKDFAPGNVPPEVVRQRTGL
jgi:uncharacterized protein DUF2510